MTSIRKILSLKNRLNKIAFLWVERGHTPSARDLQQAQYRPLANRGFVMPFDSDALTLGQHLCFLQGLNQATQQQQSDS